MSVAPVSTPPEVLTDAARAIGRARCRLEWLVRIPEWEETLAAGLATLELPGQRQGIGLRAALLALPLEHKFSLVRWALGHLRVPLGGRVAVATASIWSLDRLDPREVDTALTVRQTEAFLESLGAALGREQRFYKQAQAVLFAAYRGVVATVVRRLVFSPAHQADATQEGSLALLAAIDRIDQAETAFGAYAAHWVRRRVRNFLLIQRVPVTAPVNWISRQVGPPAAPVGDLTRPRLPSAVPFDSPVGHEPRALTPAEQLGELDPDPAERMDREERVRRLRSCLAVLSSKQREVVELRFGLGPPGVEPLTLQETARRVGISHQQVSMRERRALRRLGELLTAGPDRLPSTQGA